jgi:cysteine synthase
VPDQFANEFNPQAHYQKTADEIIGQSRGINAFVAAIGTGGTLMGVSRRLKEKCPNAKVIGVEPYPGHRLQGMKNMEESAVPEIFQRELLDETVYVNDSDANEYSRRLAREEGLLVGMSSGAAMWAAARVASKMQTGTVVVLFPDRGDRYLSTGLFSKAGARALIPIEK